MTADQENSPRERSALREIVETVVFTLLIYLLVRTFLFENYRVVGQSMVPSLQNNQFLVVSKLDYRLHEPRRGDIIVFRDPFNPERKLIKRIIGLPGENVEVQNGQVLVDQARLSEPYIADLGRYNQALTPIPDGQYYVLGDNRNNSSDSHSWGLLAEDKIVGKALLCYWPPELWGLLPHAVYANDR
ncbi:MAG: signal peptidase I [Chloroflexi bacterium]|nr:MAG: signal peptidase I [Chloroflexota bacterium]